jgi:predicted AlkP superfamily pyrophosphatase or phosphodiesterase
MLRRQFLPALAAAALAPSLRAQARKDRQVIVISIDGLPAYAFGDSNVSLPTIRRLAKEGAIAEGMRTVNPAVTWPNHTAMVTGVTAARHGVLYNGLPVRGGEGKPLRVEPWVPKEQLVQAPTVYDLAHAAGLTTAEVDWVAIHHAKTINWNFAERPMVEDAIPREMIAAGLLTESDVKDFAKTQIVRRDEIWTDAAVHILKKHKPNLLLFHLLATDSSQHRYGARSLGGYTALGLADARVKQIVDAAGENSTILIVSDHGFKTYDKVIHPNALMAAKGLGEDVWIIPEGGSAMVYITRAAKKAELAPRLRTELAALKGVSRVIEPADFASLGFPAPNERMADMVLLAEDRYSFDGTTTGDAVTEVPAGSTPGAHGYINSDGAMHAAFVAWGAGIKPGTKLGLIRNLDVAPTIASLLGLEMNNIEGKALTQILR